MSETSIVEGPAKPETRPTAPREEKIEFLNHAIQSAEGHVRAFDTKAEIAIAAFVLSWTPLWTILSASCKRAAMHDAVFVLLLLIIATILAFGYVIWPVSLATSGVIAAGKKGLFFLVHRLKGGVTEYMQELDNLVTEEDLASEALKLAYIREIKSKRFKRALCVAMLAYAAYIVCYLLLRNCTA